MGDINVGNWKTVANEIVRALDCADNSEDKKISASIWNAFVADKGGKRIQNYITLGNALKSVSIYMQKMVEKTGETVNEISSKWEKEVGLIPKDENPPVDDTNLPSKDSNPPSKDLNPPGNDDKAKSDRVKNIINGKIYEADVLFVSDDDYNNNSVQTYKYNVRNDNGNIIRTLYITPDGSLYRYEYSEYDEEGKETRFIMRNEDGTIKEYRDSEYDENGNKIRDTWRYSDGTVSDYSDLEYDKNGKMIRETFRDSDGTVSNYSDLEYDENGNMIRKTSRDSNGKVRYYSNLEYDENGNKISETWRDSDGTEYLKEDY